MVFAFTCHALNHVCVFVRDVVCIFVYMCGSVCSRRVSCSVGVFKFVSITYFQFVVRMH